MAIAAENQARGLGEERRTNGRARQLTLSLRGAGGKFSLDTEWCMCMRPMAVPCHALMPDDYFVDVPYDLATWIQRKWSRHFDAGRDHGDGLAVEAQVTVHDKDSVTIQHPAFGVATIGATFHEALNDRPLSARVMIQRLYSDASAAKPTTLTHEQVAMLRPRTEAAWADFIATLPPPSFCLDVKLYKLKGRAIVRLGSIIAARIMVYPPKVGISPVDAACKLSPSFQINANGFTTMITEPCAGADPLVTRLYGMCVGTMCPRETDSDAPACALVEGAVREVRTNFGVLSAVAIPPPPHV